MGVTDGEQIWLHDRLLQVERRCALTHEQVHLERGTQCVDGKEEQRVRRITAERLIALDDLIPAAQWSADVAEMADTLWVTEDVLRDRIAGLSPVERGLVACAVRQAWHQA